MIVVNDAGRIRASPQLGYVGATHPRATAEEPTGLACGARVLTSALHDAGADERRSQWRS
jgi:hypothetical protein